MAFVEASITNHYCVKINVHSDGMWMEISTRAINDPNFNIKLRLRQKNLMYTFNIIIIIIRNLIITKKFCK